MFGLQPNFFPSSPSFCCSKDILSPPPSKKNSLFLPCLWRLLFFSGWLFRAMNSANGGTIPLCDTVLPIPGSTDIFLPWLANFPAPLVFSNLLQQFPGEVFPPPRWFIPFPTYPLALRSQVICAFCNWLLEPPQNPL